MASDDANPAPDREPKEGTALGQFSDSPFLSSHAEPRDDGRSWISWAIAAAAVVVVVGVFVALSYRGKSDSNLAGSAPDPYAAYLPISQLQMSQATNFAGSKLTYVDGQIANTGSKTVVGVTVRVTFKNDMGEPPQQEIMPLRLIRTRDPYVDIEPVSAEPLKPGDTKPFRLIFDHVTANWNEQYPEIRVVRSEEQ